VDAARDEFAARGCSVLVVSQAKPEVLALYLSRSNWSATFVCDPERNAHKAFGLERTGWLTFFKPRILWGYLREVFRGRRVRRPYAGEDLLQLGGDFILSRERKVMFAYPSADPIDRPAIADLLGAIPSAEPMPRDTPPD
jgi:hypothetical protein